MQSRIAIFQPYDYIGPKMTPGHKKDIYVISKFLASEKVECTLLFCKNSALYYENGEICPFNLIDVIKGKALSDHKLFFGPLYRFRHLLPLLAKRQCIFYVADSVLKTSVQAFARNPLLLHRVIYATAVEYLLRRHQIIVASLEENSWHTSCGHPVDKIYLIPPVPVSNVCVLDKQKSGNGLLFVYNPNGHGVELTVQLLSRLIAIDKNIRVIISGPKGQEIKESLASATTVSPIDYVEDVDALIAEADVVLITDVGGSGVCNRAVQVRHLGGRLVCTPDSVRGTSLHLDVGVKTFNEVHEGVSLILSELNCKNRVGSSLSSGFIKYSLDELKKFASKCLPH